MKLSVYALIPVAIFSTLHGVILILGRKLRCQAASIAAPHALSKAQAIMRELLGEAHRVRVEVMEDLCPIIIQLVDDDECVCVSVAPSFFELEGRGVSDLFTIYGLLLDYVRDDATLCVNMWNVLCSLTERRLEDLLVRDKGMMHDDCKDVQAVASLLSSQYNIQRWLPPSWCRHAKRAPHELLAVTRRGQHSKFHAALLFSRTVMHSCTPAIVGVAALLILANNLRSFITTLSYADVDELSLVELLAEQSSVETTSMLAFFSVSRHRRMLEIMTTVFVAEAFFPFISGVTEAFSKYLTSWYSRHMHSVVYAAMARRDYLSTSDKFCLDVENAIIMVTDFSLVNVSYLINHTLTKLTYLRMLYVAPVLCGITAMGEVWLNEMRHHWARAECLYTLFSLKSDKTCGPDTTDAAPPPSAQDVAPVVGESPRGVPVSVDEINQLFAMQRSTGEEGKHWQYTQPPSRLGAKSLPGSVLIPLLRHINTAPTISALAVDGEALATFNNPSDATSFLSVVPDVVDYVVRDAPPMIFCGDVTPYHYDILAQKDGMDGGKEPFVEGMEVLNRLRAESPKIDVSWTNLLRAPDGPWSVEMVDVWFAYPGQTTYALREVSFSIHAGGCVGIIGYSGAGKSTFLALLARLYLPQRGHIFINAIPIEHFAARELRRRIGNVWQETTSMRFLTDENVGNNLAYGNLRHASTSNIHSALNDAGMTDAVLRRGRGLHEMISHNCFSGGEYERLSIARSFVNRDACLRILDEPTSALDSSTESMILQNIRRPPQGSTDPMQATLMFATHRISSVKDADLILVIAGGKVVEQGSWALLSSEGNPHFHTLLEAHALPR